MIIHDLSKAQAEAVLAGIKDDTVISDNGKIKNCIGCFGCWIKTPSECVIKDGYEHIGGLLSQCSNLLIISECLYGGYSAFVKNVMDRSISYVHPYFEIRNGEMHHKRRYDNTINLNVCFYGEDITQDEKTTAVGLVCANALNMRAALGFVNFTTIGELMNGGYFEGRIG